MTPSVLVTFLVALALPVAASAQAPADFSGTWTMDLARSESPTYAEFVGPVTVVITQTPSEVRIETTRGAGPATITVRTTYEIQDAADAEARAGDSTDTVAYWDGATLVTEGVHNVRGETVQTRERRTLNAATGEMRVESILIVEHGYSLRGTPNYGKADDVFTRVRGGGDAHLLPAI